MLHSTTYDVTCDCGLLIERDQAYTPGEWLYEIAEGTDFLDEYHTYGEYYIIHAPSLQAWGPISSYELAEQLLSKDKWFEFLSKDKWFESFCYLGDQDNLDVFKQISVYLPSEYDSRYQSYDMKDNSVPEKEFIL